ncbi:hypothetical protein SGLAD_v1c03460 [Spiroplasma gladiatoris]|uniref:Uncharacterized protein n=1 Tax=Spiroplasma gladiatoris TaxID=2143 RepID=A0A4P7AGM4_9MOLU|nr:hypothetical protein [Spiroplasma gladiatoris]QBQ07545.1 hypothetical protein SGLAD_v1c03460 [Spiroplasma gladiatoris]
MTDQQANNISEFIDNLDDEIADKMFEELIAGMSLYFAILNFGEEIDRVFEDEKNKDLSLEEKAKIIKSAPIGEEEIYASLMGWLSEEDKAQDFAEDCTESIAFNPEYPQVLLDKLKELEIEEADFSINLIVTFKDQFIDFFVNDIDIEEWKNDIIDALVVSWE